MKRPYFPSEYFPVTAVAHRRGADGAPVTELRGCTPSRLLQQTGLAAGKKLCILGAPARAVSVAEVLRRRSEKPLLLLGAAVDRDSALAALQVDWTLDDAPSGTLPDGDGAVFFSHPVSAYPELCRCLEEEGAARYPVLHIGSGLQIGPEVLNLLGAVGEYLLLCDALPQGLRSGENALTVTGLLEQTDGWIAFGAKAGSVTNELCDLLATYPYRKITNTAGSSVNVYASLRRAPHVGFGTSSSQSETTEFGKRVLEPHQLQALFAEGRLLVCDPGANGLYVASLL